MDRRKFLAGVGAGAIGGSALLGSGAFTRVESQRRTKITVAHDMDAYLGLQGCPDSPNNSYTGFEDGHLTIEMSPDNPNIEANNDGAKGTGINSDSITYFDNVFQICNQGKQPVAVWIEAAIAENIELDRDYREKYDPVLFYVGDDSDRRIDGDNPELLQVGECLCVGIRTVTKGLKEGDQLLDGDEIVINADADVAADPEEGSVWNQTQGTRHDTIQAAIDNANEEDTIKVFEDGNGYEENVHVHESVNLVGVGNPEVVSQSPPEHSPSEAAMLIDADTVRVDNIDLVEGISPGHNQDILEIADGVTGTTVENLDVLSPDFTGTETGQGAIGAPVGEAMGDILIDNVNVDRTIGLVVENTTVDISSTSAIKSGDDGQALWIAGEGFSDADTLTLELHDFVPSNNDVGTGDSTDVMIFGHPAEVNGETGSPEDQADQLFDDNADVDEVEIDGQTFTR